MVLQETFRRIVKVEIARQGISQRELARKMGVAQPMVNRYLTGKICPVLDVVEKFLVALDLPLEIPSEMNVPQQT
ncbi:helix-turn-helix protein [Thalassoglobus neptunius]|uniref:Helix-turn-helix protein n=1 Tax=Thalassoglobus neptunius TaxID=1938619 RepID=A0A5C5WD04_9PLAN|nr:helix-turn-helix transcriptional regulator [Thalassoglobus neptunius]TWT47951.1 helix-turn-helix protein [Thalassoglobus neptunius]